MLKNSVFRLSVDTKKWAKAAALRTKAVSGYFDVPKFSSVISHSINCGVTIKGIQNLWNVCSSNGDNV